MGSVEKPMRVQVESFAQVSRADLTFGDLTVLVGPQASGKSLILQLFKLGLDRDEIVHTLREAGQDTKDPGDFMDLYLGQGMRHAWRAGTKVTVAGKSLSPRAIARSRGSRTPGKVFFIPAHRALLLAEGWPAPFLRLGADTPTVARLFSQRLYELFANPKADNLFPMGRVLKSAYRSAIDTSVFHGAKVKLQREHMAKRLTLSHGDADIPFMTWTAGQREFTPILLGLYHLLPPRRMRKREEIDWVVIEEPEMGLHPRAVTVVMLLVLDLLWRGYKVVLSSHSPAVVEVPFTLRVLSSLGPTAGKRAVAELAKAFGVERDQQTRPVFQAALRKSFRTYYMKFEGRQVVSQDISDLDPAAATDEAGWGGLTEYSARFHDAIASCVG